MAHQGLGKTILFGEHFVVYGIPALAAAIALKTTAEAKKSKKFKLSFKPKISSKEQVFCEKVAKHLAKILRIETEFTLKINQGVPFQAGMGGSAAFNVAVVRALNACFRLRLSDSDVNATAFQGEKLFHGNPSGIDNTVATFGDLLWFQKSFSGKNIVEKLPSPGMHVVIAHTGVKGSTLEAVEHVKKLKQSFPDVFDRIFEAEQRIVEEARRALIAKDAEKVGALMNINQGLLSSLGVSIQAIDNLVNAAREQGAVGAKIMGSGFGGSVIALCKSPADQNKVYSSLKKEVKLVVKTKI